MPCRIWFPRRIRRGIGKGDLLWGALNHSRVTQLLHNPRYAGAFVYGRTRGAYNADLKHVQRAVNREHWQVLIRDAHAGYISWEEFERNQITLRENAFGFSKGLRGGAPREGNALLQGRVLCGQCGARMRVHYELLSGQRQPYYRCNEQLLRNAERPCLWVKGVAIDQAIGALLLETVAPAAIEVALAVQQEIAQRVEQAGALRQAQLQRARYEAELARRRYAKVDPDNRLVADALEAEWNDRLRQLDALQRDHERQQQADQSLMDEPARKRILELARDFPRVWNDPRTSAVERKRMLGLLIEDVTLVGGPQTTVNVRWRGGRIQTLFVDRPVPIARIRRTLPEVVQLIDELFETLSDPEVVKRLNELNHRNCLGEAGSLAGAARVGGRRALQHQRRTRAQQARARRPDQPDARDAGRSNLARPARSSRHSVCADSGHTRSDRRCADRGIGHRRRMRCRCCAASAAITAVLRRTTPCHPQQRAEARPRRRTISLRFRTMHPTKRSADIRPSP